MTAGFNQIFVTHCTPNDSVFGQAGYTVRASSIKEDADKLGLLKIALLLNPYELPPCYWGVIREPNENPVRLAAVILDSLNLKDFVAIVHSVYKSKDTRGRPNSYFSHIVFVPKNEFTWKKTLNSWNCIFNAWETIKIDEAETALEVLGSNEPKWIIDWPQEGPSELPKLKCLPFSKSHNDPNFVQDVINYKFNNNDRTLNIKPCEIILRGCLERVKHKFDQQTPNNQQTSPYLSKGFLISRSMQNNDMKSK